MRRWTASRCWSGFRRLSSHARALPFDSSSFSFTKDYLAATDEELAKTKDVAGFYYAMVKRFPDANLFISNEMNSGVFKGGVSWNWRDD